LKLALSASVNLITNSSTTSLNSTILTNSSKGLPLYRDPETNLIIETFEDEILNSFEKADYEAGETVDVIYAVDSRTGKDIEIWRADYIS
jgi:hypothetical protein